MYVYDGGSHANGNVALMGISICKKLWNVACAKIARVFL